MKKKLKIDQLKVTSFVTSVEQSTLRNIKGGETLRGGACEITRDIACATFDRPCPTFPCQTPPVTGIWCITDDVFISEP